LGSVFFWAGSHANAVKKQLKLVQQPGIENRYAALTQIARVSIIAGIRVQIPWQRWPRFCQNVHFTHLRACQYMENTLHDLFFLEIKENRAAGWYVRTLRYTLGTCIKHLSHPHAECASDVSFHNMQSGMMHKSAIETAKTDSHIPSIHENMLKHKMIDCVYPCKYEMYIHFM
jgi:hypothetical protein